MHDLEAADTPPAKAWSWRAEPACVPLARHTVMDHLRTCATADPPLSDVGLTVSEAVTNVVHHAYVDRSVGDVRVRLSFSAEELALVVEDDGGGMRPRPDTPGLGLGLPLMATVASRIETQDVVPHGTHFCAWFARES